MFSLSVTSSYLAHVIVWLVIVNPDVSHLQSIDVYYESIVSALLNASIPVYREIP